MTHYINLTDEAGHIVQTPLWKLPQLVSAEVEEKKGHIATLKAQQEAREKFEKANQKAIADAKIAEAAGLDKPFDLSKVTDLG